MFKSNSQIFFYYILSEAPHDTGLREVLTLGWILSYLSFWSDKVLNIYLRFITLSKAIIYNYGILL